MRCNLRCNPAGIRTSLTLAAAIALAACAGAPQRPAASAPDAAPAETAAATASQSRRFETALADIEAGNLEAARDTLQALVDQSPGLAAAQNNLGVVYRRLGEFEQAQTAYEAALEADPDNARAHRNLGILYDVYLQRPADALSHYERFQSLSDAQDKEVALWIADLKRRL